MLGKPLVWLPWGSALRSIRERAEFLKLAFLEGRVSGRCIIFHSRTRIIRREWVGSNTQNSARMCIFQVCRKSDVGLQHLGRIPSRSEVPDTCFLRYFVQFFFSFFFVSTRYDRFFLWVHQVSLGISPLAARKNAWDLSGGRSGYRLGFIRGPLGISLGIYPVAAREIAWDFYGGR